MPPGKKNEKRRKRDHRRACAQQVEVVGKTELSLYSPKGELRGALLEDGSIVRIRPNEAHRFAEFLQPRASLAVRGEGIETPYGRVVKAREIDRSQQPYAYERREVHGACLCNEMKKSGWRRRASRHVPSGGSRGS
jgi:hypothetical protein